MIERKYIMLIEIKVAISSRFAVISNLIRNHQCFSRVQNYHRLTMIFTLEREAPLMLSEIRSISVVLCCGRKDEDVFNQMGGWVGVGWDVKVCVCGYNCDWHSSLQ